ncbi:MAG: ABC transporter ATP-binding protein [Chloroflexi bacterium]|nr:ABC transporter ATP-binding protein [Chloroflexota bacterium]
MVELIEVTRIYQMGERLFHALRGVSLQVEQGEFVAIVGPSGSGKSTLLNMIAGIDRPTSGEVWVGGVRIDVLGENELARWRGRYIGIVFQFFQLLPTLTVLENVLLPMQLRDLWGGEGDVARAEAILERVGMGAHLYKLPAELSGGERQRVALARALANDPPVLIADEPTGNLDSATGADIVRLFQEQHQAGKTVILVTHEQRLAGVAGRVVHMLDGQIYDGNAPSLAARPEQL